MIAPPRTAAPDLSRRSFVKAAGLAAATAVVAAPAFLRAEDKAGDKAPVLGAGRHAYEVIDQWAKLPEGKRFGNTHAVIESADGRIFIHSTSPTGDATCVFDPEGRFITSWGKPYAGGAHGMDYRKENGQEFLYLAPTGMHKVFKTTLDGQVVMELDFPRDARDVQNGQVVPCYNGPGKYVPTFIAFGPDKPAAKGGGKDAGTDASKDAGGAVGVGDFYVTDGYGSNYVHRYNARGEYLQSWGGSGGKANSPDEPGRLHCPHGIWCDTRDPATPMIVVADRANVRLQWFTLDGKFVKMLRNEPGVDNLRHPCHFDQREGDLLVPDLFGRVTIFDKDNKLVCHLGDNPNPKQRGNNGVPQKDLVSGAFCTPHSAKWDSHGNIFVVEWLPYGRVTKLKRQA